MSGTTTTPRNTTPDQLHAALLADSLPEELTTSLRDGYADALANLSDAELYTWKKAVLRELGEHGSRYKPNTFIALHCQPSEHEGFYSTDQKEV